jgi:hypothetical protein
MKLITEEWLKNKMQTDFKQLQIEAKKYLGELEIELTKLKSDLDYYSNMKRTFAREGNKVKSAICDVAIDGLATRIKSAEEFHEKIIKDTQGMGIKIMKIWKTGELK